MNPDFWHERWRQGETGWHETEINVHLSEHWPRLGVNAGERVFVPLCGKSSDLLWLAGEGHRVLGVEISRLAVEAFFTENALHTSISEEPPFLRYRAAELEILCGDFFDLTKAHLAGVRGVYDRASLVALPPEMRPGYAEHLQALLGADVKVLLITFDYDQSEMSGPPFSVTENEVRELFGDRFDMEPVARKDVLAENDQFRQQGLSHLLEQVYVLR
jgi:thiopurine S-methyltransferase